MSVLLAIVPLILQLQGQPAPAQPPSFSASLVADQTAVAPGGEVNLALVVKVGRPWHIYHPIALDTGLPTRVKWSIPAGASRTPVEFPTPELGSTAGLEYLALEGDVILLTRLHAPPDAEPGTELTIRAAVSALACIEMCVPVDASAVLRLPVSAADSIQPANADLFKQARESIPPRLETADHLQGSSLTVQPGQLKLKSPGQILVKLRVAEGEHIWHADPGVEGLIGSRLFIEPRDGVEIGEPVWPTPHEVELPQIGKAREQRGEFQVRVPISITDEKFPSGPVSLRVLLRYQACNDAGQCFAPMMAAARATFTADTPNPPAESTELAVVAEAPDGADSSGDADDMPVAATTSLPLALLLGFLGGLILNIMPCVLPVISIKVVSFVQQAGEDPRRVLHLGLAFCAGIMVWFWLFAILSAQGNLPLQYPAVVIGVGTVLFVLALSLFGVFEIVLPGSAASFLDTAARREGLPGAFFKGFLATLLGTACTAPFLAGAVIYAATQPWTTAFLVFTAAGLGMSAPYLLLTANPRWMKFIPKPGNWMITFKQAMGFVLAGTAVWLLWILGGQLGADGVVWTVSFWVFVGVGAWLVGKISPAWSPAARVTTMGAAVLIVLGGGAFSYMLYEPPPQPTTNVARAADEVIAHVARTGWDHGIPWAPYSPGVAAELAQRGYTVYVDYTARWCATCLANKAVAVEIAATHDKMRDLGVLPIKADFTNRNRDIARDLQAHGRPSVPLNLVYPAGRPAEVIELPVVLTPRIVAQALDDAGPTQTAIAAAGAH